ncbi:MAG TPA: DUF4136 domain-containing protein [Steroidobacteraceae bacterium]|nr:DUF4136 domain-containing protein [Steroidobacteraceae bacterium]
MSLRRSGPRRPLLLSLWLAGALSALALAACETTRVSSDYDHAASFASYHSFTWLARERHGSANPLVVQRAHDAIQAELTRRGFTYTENAAAADFVVDFTIGARERVDVQSYPSAYMGPGWWGPGWWGYPYWGTDVDVHQYREGTLSIDLFDGHSHRAVWHGWARKELTRSDMENSEAPIRAAVAAVLARFPPS